MKVSYRLLNMSCCWCSLILEVFFKWVLFGRIMIYEDLFKEQEPWKVVGGSCRPTDRCGQYLFTFDKKHEQSWYVVLVFRSMYEVYPPTVYVIKSFCTWKFHT